jgi:hypothetical protein
MSELKHDQVVSGPSWRWPTCLSTDDRGRGGYTAYVRHEPLDHAASAASGSASASTAQARVIVAVCDRVGRSMTSGEHTSM